MQAKRVYPKLAFTLQHLHVIRMYCLIDMDKTVVKISLYFGGTAISDISTFL